MIPILAASGEAALQCLEGDEPDLVLLDIFMPGMDGFETLRRIRERPGGQLPVVAVSASVRQGEQDRVIAAGFDSFLPKPVEIAQLTDTLARLLDLSWYRKEQQEPARTDASWHEEPISPDAQLWSAWQSLGDFPSLNHLAEFAAAMREHARAAGDARLDRAGAELAEAAESFDPNRCAAVVAALKRCLREPVA